MDNKEYFDSVCALAPPEERVSVESGYIRQCKLVGGDVVYQFTIHASGVTAISTVSFQDVFDGWKARIDNGRSQRIADLRNQLATLEGEA